MDLADGEHEVTVNGCIISATLAGDFNKEGAVKYTDRMRSVIANFNGNAFAILIDDLSVKGGTPEAYAELNSYNIWLSNQNLIAKAFVIDCTMTKTIMLKRAPALLCQNVEFFSEIPPALAWLNKQLA